MGGRCGVSDPVNHPDHYTAGPVEVIDILEQAVAAAPGAVLAGLHKLQQTATTNTP
jgi:hypothetical protein